MVAFGRWFLAACACFVLAACSGSGSSSSQPSDGMAIKLLPAYSDDVADYALAEATLDMPMVASLDALGLRGRFTSVRIAAAGDRIMLPRLAADVAFDLVLADGAGRERTVHVHALPPDFPRYSVSVTGPVSPGRIYAGLFSGLGLSTPTYNMIFAPDGTPLYFRRLDHPAINFQRIVYADGRVRYAYFDARFEALPGKGSSDGDVVLLDESFREIRRLRLLPFRSHGPLPSENHDFIFFDDDHYVLSAYDVRTVDLTALGGKPDAKVSAAIVQEVDHGTVVWEWDSTDYPQLYGASVNGNDFRNANAPIADYLHFNSIEFDPVDRTFLMSFRHLDAILKIAPFEARTGAPIAIKWILGGKLDQFGLAPAQRFYHQHDARVLAHNGSAMQLSIFNNNNGHFDEHASSAMVLAIDEASRTATVVDEYSDDILSAAQGSVEVIEPRHYFISWGLDNRVSEAVAGKRVFLMDFDGLYQAYRARKSR
jgi:arylsulfate sulfotransferase